jgi:hypothetical protein
MCVVSNVGDHFGRRWDKYPLPNPNPQPGFAPQDYSKFFKDLGKTELETLKAEVRECAELLKLAVEMDRRMGTPDCSTEAKTVVLRRVLAAFGHNLDEILTVEVT